MTRLEEYEAEREAYLAAKAKGDAAARRFLAAAGLSAGAADAAGHEMIDRYEEAGRHLARMRAIAVAIADEEEIA